MSGELGRAEGSETGRVSVAGDLEVGADRFRVGDEWKKKNKNGGMMAK